MRMIAMMIAIMIINRTVLVLLLKTTGVIDRFRFFLCYYKFRKRNSLLLRVLLYVLKKELRNFNFNFFF
jgi:hypothetical protein